MGSTQSAQVPSEEEEDDDDEEEEEEDDNDGLNHVPGDNLLLSKEVGAGAGNGTGGNGGTTTLIKKVLEQEPEMLPCHPSASPLSPQLSSLGTPRLGPCIKVWDPYNVLAPPPPLQPQFPSADILPSDEDHLHHHRSSVTEVYLICHGECHMNLRPDLIAGRCPEAALTPNGKRQARALAVFLKSQGVRFSVVYSSPLDRARATALLLCQELSFSEEQIQSSDALMEMSQGHWEGCHRSEIFTTETVSLMERSQPDFSAPSGESLRQVEFRMVQFLNGTILALPEKLRSDLSPPDRSEAPGFPGRGSRAFTNSSIHEREGPSLHPPQWDLLHKHRQGLPRKKSDKSRLQMVTTGDNEADDEMSPRPPMNQDPVREMSTRGYPSADSARVAVFTHSVPIKCLITGVLGCSAVMTHKICIEESSVTVLQHSWKMGWQIKRLNDTAHLRLL